MKMSYEKRKNEEEKKKKVYEKMKNVREDVEGVDEWWWREWETGVGKKSNGCEA